MTAKKPSDTEEEYFAHEEAARLHALAVEKQRQTEHESLEAQKTLHWMHCPKCGFSLDTIQFRGLAIDRCFHCGGTWLDAGELERLAGHDHGILASVIGLFKNAPRASRDK